MINTEEFFFLLIEEEVLSQWKWLLFRQSVWDIFMTYLTFVSVVVE